jgi:hypothetical protein
MQEVKVTPETYVDVILPVEAGRTTDQPSEMSYNLKPN